MPTRPLQIDNSNTHGFAYDVHGQKVGEVAQGRIYDLNGKRQGEVVNGRVYDAHGGKVGDVISGHLYDAAGVQVGRIESDGNTYATNGDNVGYVWLSRPDPMLSGAAALLLLLSSNITSSPALLP